MPANVDAMLREGMAAFKAGNKAEARAFLMKAVEVDQYHEDAWLMLSAVVETIEDQRTCLENVLAINPDNEKARAGLQRLNGPMGDSSAAFDFSPHADTPAAIPTSVEWGVQDSGAVQTGSRSPEASNPDYDSWLTNLNLPGSTTASAPAPPPPSAPNGKESPAAFGGLSVFDGDDPDDVLAGGFAAGPFSTAEFEDIFTPTSASATFTGSKAASASRKVMSPGREAPVPRADTELSSSNLFAEFEDADADEIFGELNAEELFRFIPEEIRPTRLPGTQERYPVLVIVGLVLLIILNMGAVALLASKGM